MAESYYDVLGVDTDATQDEITEAYRSQVLEVHPDRSADPNAAARFDMVTDARAVLTDDLERARYDRLGHDAYCRLESLCASTSSSDSDASRTGSNQGEDADSQTTSGSTRGASSARTSTTEQTADGDRTASRKTTRATSSGPTDSTASTSNTDWQHAGAQTTGDRDRTESHHAGQRRRRERMAWLGANATGTSSTAGNTRNAKRRPGNQRATREPTKTESRSFRYAVHGWDGEITLSRPHRELDRPTEIAVACIALLYPLLVYSSLSPAFWLPVNVIVGTCTLALVGYLLTMPRVAFATFGGWALVASVAIWYLWPIDPVLGGLALAAFWVPFGYAGTVWWALRPR
ncbi:DnaJ domain-containing protein [Halobacteria archaeon AArc-curdl1]|uniref:DnaJ domain-containing protein n=1 Tax=Natronosalvus hydrolyticus TaxID=2979988 RepID=A0AAP2ZAF6_9EURY|nr:DnaJ domain-containing protein [Halobacteria archaeon AArc-curdl1]